VATSFFLPYEIYELAAKVTWLRAAAFAINLLLVIYLVWTRRLFGIRGGKAAYDARLRSESVIEAEEAALAAEQSRALEQTRAAEQTVAATAHAKQETPCAAGQATVPPAEQAAPGPEQAERAKEQQTLAAAPPAGTAPAATPTRNAAPGPTRPDAPQ
jgi:Predicted membrane protein (DUF2127)